MLCYDEKGKTAGLQVAIYLCELRDLDHTMSSMLSHIIGIKHALDPAQYLLVIVQRPPCWTITLGRPKSESTQTLPSAPASLAAFVLCQKAGMKDVGSIRVLGLTAWRLPCWCRNAGRKVWLTNRRVLTYRITIHGQNYCNPALKKMLEKRETSATLRKIPVW